MGTRPKKKGGQSGAFHQRLPVGLDRERARVPGVWDTDKSYWIPIERARVPMVYHLLGSVPGGWNRPAQMHYSRTPTFW